MTDVRNNETTLPAPAPAPAPTAPAAPAAPAPAAAAPAAPAPTAPDAPEPERPARGRRRWIALLVLLLLLACALAWFYLAPAPEDDDIERNIVVGSVLGDDAAPVRDASETTAAFSINSIMRFDSPSSKAYIYFENPEGNGKYLSLALVRDDTGQTVYQTGLLQPGTYVEQDALDAMLPYGEYACTAQVSAFRIPDKTPLGTVAAAVTVKVGS